MAANKVLVFQIQAVDPTDQVNKFFQLRLIFNSGTGVYDAYIVDQPGAGIQSQASLVVAGGTPLAGVGAGDVSGSGTPGAIPIWTGATTLGDADPGVDYPGLDTANPFSGVNTFSLPNIAEDFTPVLIVRNPTNATLGIPIQNSPTIQLVGSFFDGDGNLIPITSEIALTSENETATLVITTDLHLLGGFQIPNITGLVVIVWQNGVNLQGAVDNDHILLLSHPDTDPVFLDATGGLQVNGVQVVEEQQPAIADPTGGIVIDAEGRATIGEILTALRTHGLIDI